MSGIVTISTNGFANYRVLSGMRTVLSLIFTLLIGFSGFAQKGPYFCSICKDHNHAEGPPYELNFKREVPFIVSSAAILGAGFLAAELNTTKPYTTEELASLNINSINAFDRRSVHNYSTTAASASDYIRSGITIFPILLISEHHTKKDLTALLAMSAEVMAITWGITNTVKNVVNRARPNVYNPDVPLSERTSVRSKRSFFSGHTSHTAAAAFFMAKVISDYHPNMNKGTKITLWAVSSYIPVLTAYLRVKAGKHFPTDVMAGYAVGAFTGWLIPHLHKTSRTSILSKLDMNVYPSNEGMQFSLRIGL